MLPKVSGNACPTLNVSGVPAGVVTSTSLLVSAMMQMEPPAPMARTRVVVSPEIRGSLTVARAVWFTMMMAPMSAGVRI